VGVIPAGASACHRRKGRVMACHPALFVVRLRSPGGLPQHADEHRTERPVFFAVDQQFGEGAGRRFPS
jgi:hypothetical protein